MSKFISSAFAGIFLFMMTFFLIGAGCYHLWNKNHKLILVSKQKDDIIKDLQNDLQLQSQNVDDLKKQNLIVKGEINKLQHRYQSKISSFNHKLKQKEKIIAQQNREYQGLDNDHKNLLQQFATNQDSFYQLKDDYTVLVKNFRTEKNENEVLVMNLENAWQNEDILLKDNKFLTLKVEQLSQNVNDVSSKMVAEALPVLANTKMVTSQLVTFILGGLIVFLFHNYNLVNFFLFKRIKVPGGAKNNNRQRKKLIIFNSEREVKQSALFLGKNGK